MINDDGSDLVAKLRKVPLSGEKRLMLAVLHDALSRFQTRDYPFKANGKVVVREAAHWIWSDDRDWPFAYLNICELLDIDPHWLRSELATSEQKPGRRVR